MELLNQLTVAIHIFFAQNLDLSAKRNLAPAALAARRLGGKASLVNVGEEFTHGELSSHKLVCKTFILETLDVIKLSSLKNRQKIGLDSST